MQYFSIFAYKDDKWNTAIPNADACYFLILGNCVAATNLPMGITTQDTINNDKLTCG
jgi:hypothetical protein